MTRRPPVAPISGPESARSISEQTQIRIRLLERGLCSFVVGQDDQTDQIREMVVRLLRAGFAESALLRRLAIRLEAAPMKEVRRTLTIAEHERVGEVLDGALEQLFAGSIDGELAERLVRCLMVASPAEVRRILDIKMPNRVPDWRRRHDTCQTYFEALEQTGDDIAALRAAYDSHFGAQAFGRDERLSNEGRDAWPYRDVAQSVAATRMIDTVLPLLKAGGFELGGAADLLQRLGLCIDQKIGHSLRSGLERT